MHYSIRLLLPVMVFAYVFLCVYVPDIKSLKTTLALKCHYWSVQHNLIVYTGVNIKGGGHPKSWVDASGKFHPKWLDVTDLAAGGV